MSEYEYYEFQAIDRPLSAEDLRALRAVSSRATITPTHFSNFYTFGSLKANPLERAGRRDDFERRLKGLRDKHRAKSAFLRQLLASKV